MGGITAIRRQKGFGKRVGVFLDGKFALSLETEVAVKEELQVGKDLSANQVEALARSDRSHRCFNAAVHYLAYRPRSESELRGRLQQRRFENDIIEGVIVKLKQQGLVDDMAFAQFWRDNRESFSPRSQWLTKLELRQKGIAGDIIDRVVSTVDDNACAYRVSLNKAYRLPKSDYRIFRHRLGEYLKRRGFDYEVIDHTIERIWQVLGGGGE